MNLRWCLHRNCFSEYENAKRDYMTYIVPSFGVQKVTVLSSITVVTNSPKSQLK